MPANDPDYYRSRAHFERRRAAEAPTEKIAAVHAELADLYDELVKELEQPALPVAANVLSLPTRKRQVG